MPDRDLSPVARRGLLAGGVVSAVALSGCDLLSGGSDDEPSGTVATTEPAVDADGRLAEDVADETAAAAALAQATAAAVPSLRDVARDFRRLHLAHGKVLGGLPDVDVPDVPARPGRARAGLLAAEERLQGRLTTAAMRAQSGALAQTFAAMAAGVAQLRSVDGR